MGKVSIALKGWRFDEEAVFDDDGRFLPLEEMDPDTRLRVNRLTTLREKPCDACWLIHGDEEIERCRPAEYVYGEPQAEVLVCDEHLPDFSYWYLEDGGEAYRGEVAFQDAFHEWFATGNRAPDGYTGIEHEETDPQSVPDPSRGETTVREIPVPEDEQIRIDLRDPDGEGTDEGDELDDEDVREAVDDDLTDALEDL